LEKSVSLLVSSSGKSTRRAEMSGEDDVDQVRWPNDLNMRLKIRTCGLDWEIYFQKVVRNVQMDKDASRQYPNLNVGGVKKRADCDMCMGEPSI